MLYQVSQFSALFKLYKGFGFSASGLECEMSWAPSKRVGRGARLKGVNRAAKAKLVCAAHNTRSSTIACAFASGANKVRGAARKRRT